STRPAAAGSALMNASSRASEDTPIPPPHRDQDPPDFVDGAGGSAGQAHALLDGYWTEEHDSFLQGMVAYGGRHDWAGKTAVLNQNFAESFTLRQVFQRCTTNTRGLAWHKFLLLQNWTAHGLLFIVCGPSLEAVTLT
ncbi:unnamed protein product, partial [Scytosiphon promiscuus]